MSEITVDHDWGYYDALTPLTQVGDQLADMLHMWDKVPKAECTEEAFKMAVKKVHEARTALWWLRRVCDQHAG